MNCLLSNLFECEKDSDSGPFLDCCYSCCPYKQLKTKLLSKVHIKAHILVSYFEISYFVSLAQDLDIS